MLQLPTAVRLSCRTQQLKGKKLQQVSTLLNKMRELDKVMTEKVNAQTCWQRGVTKCTGH